MVQKGESGLFGTRGRRLLAGSCLIALAALSQPAMAQGDPALQDDQSSKTSDQDSGVGDIVVTARFVEESIQDTPMPITAQTSEQLEAANVTNIGTLGAVVPNLQTIPGDSQSAGTPKLRIRGVIQGESSSIAVPPAVAIYTDDIYHPTTAGSELDFTDIDHVEVNRGPQSTLSGNASIGGTVKLFTKDPQGDNSGYVTITAGSRKKLGVAGAIDLGLTPTLSLRAFGHFERQDGFFQRLDFTCQMRANGTPALAGTLPLADPSSPDKGCVLGTMGGGQMAIAQVKLRWQPAQGIDLILTARHREEDMEETPELSLYYQPNPNPNTGNALVENYNKATRAAFGIQLDNRFQATQYNDGYANFATNCRPNLPALTSNGLPTGTVLPSGYCFSRRRPAHHTLLSAKLNVDLAENLHMTAIGGYTDYANAFTQNGDQSPLGYVTSHFENSDKNWTGELRFDGKLLNDKLNWVLGGFVMRFTGHQDNNIYFLTNAQDSKVRGTNDNQSAFFHLDYNLTMRGASRAARATPTATSRSPSTTPRRAW
ncbi:MAG: TonB-dependent receptor plug domain-containing protein [Sphingomonas sp.]